MGLGMKNRMCVQATVVPDAFIDTYMAAANGEYVKVFLYLLRHEGEEITIPSIADALNHTESDVKRALTYWRDAGVLAEEEVEAETEADGDADAFGVQRHAAQAGMSGQAGEFGVRKHAAEFDEPEMPRRTGESPVSVYAGEPRIPERAAESPVSVRAAEPGPAERAATSPVPVRSDEPTVLDRAPITRQPKQADSSPILARAASIRAARETLAASQNDQLPSLLEVPDPGNTYERLERLSEDEEFSALLYAVQQYLGKTFTQIECEKFAFFYDGLKMSSELLEYLAEYCAGGGHTSIRYIEKVAINWYQLGIKTKEQARANSMRYSKDMSAVMKAFGITGRNPATAEQEYMKRWFREYGFDTALVTEACNRTIKATGSASFPYADKILTGWKECGVKVLRDVEELDKKRQLAKKQTQPQGRGKEPGKKPSGINRFKNFEERSYNYEDYVWEGMRKRQQKGGTGDGTQ